MKMRNLQESLETIGRIKNSLPFNSRGWCNELGLYVQLREARGMTRLTAGGKFRAKIDLWRNVISHPWEVKKFSPGSWQALVVPTLSLAEWLDERIGLATPVKDAFRQAVQAFRVTGTLELPQGVMSFPAESELGGILELTPHVSWDEMVSRLEAYISAHPRQAAAWDALRTVHLKRHHFKDALRAVNHAIEIAPNEGEFYFEASMIYLTTISNAIRARSGVQNPEPDLEGCTLEALGSTYQEARSAAQKNLQTVLTARTGEDYKSVARQTLAGLQKLDRIYNYWYPAE